MTLVSDDPTWWPSINSYRISSYFIVAAFAGVMYDWVLTFGQEVELVWRQRWSLMTVLYLSARYVGISYAAVNVLIWVPTIPKTDAVSLILYLAVNWMSVIVNAILGVIMIARLHAMYQRSMKVLIPLVVIFLAFNIYDGVVATIFTGNTSAEEFDLSGTYQCTFGFEGNVVLPTMTWILGTVWEVLALFLAVWIAAKHFRELRRRSVGGIMGDCFTVLMETHAVYFASIFAASCFSFGDLSPAISANNNSIYLGFLAIFQTLQICVLGPRLILGVREYHAKLVADSDAATDMTSVAFQERVHVSTSSNV